MNDHEALAAMAAFLPRLTQPPEKFGAFNVPQRRPDGTLSMPYWTHDELVTEFVEMAYRTGWVTCRDWPAWAESPEGERMMNDPDMLTRADIGQLRCLVTLLIRQDRFCDGTLIAAFEDGGILGVVTRAHDLLLQG